MSRLDEIFANPNETERQKLLLDYCQKLKVNVLKAKRPDGSYNEDELAVLIYNTEASQKIHRSQNMVFLAGGIILALIVAAAIYLLASLLS